MPMPDLMRKKVLGRNRDIGGITSLTVGTLGSGKTSLLAHTAKRLLEKKEEDEDRPRNEKLFWRSQASCQFMKFHNKVPFKILIPKTTQVNFISENGYSMSENRFESFEELYEMADANKINAIFLSFEELIDFMEWLQLTKFTWNSIFVDECEDMFPFGSSEHWSDNKRAADILKESRKYRLSFYATTQSKSDIDWRIRHKIKANIYLKGAKASSDSPLWPKTINAIKLGQGWVTIGGEYEKFEFPPYKTPFDVKARIKQGLQRIPKPEILEKESPEQVAV